MLLKGIHNAIKVCAAEFKRQPQDWGGSEQSERSQGVDILKVMIPKIITISLYSLLTAPFVSWQFNTSATPLRDVHQLRSLNLWFY